MQQLSSDVDDVVMLRNEIEMALTSFDEIFFFFFFFFFLPF
jgi:hypothetical protein